MADFSKSKTFGTKIDSSGTTSGTPTKIYPVEANEVTAIFSRVEPIITPKKMISRYLKGIDISDYSNDELKDYIEEGINEIETLTNLNLTHVQYKERIPFDLGLYKSFVHVKTNNGPILSVDDFLIESSNGENIYRLPPDWIEMGFAHKRQINLIPILTVFGASGLQDGQASNAGLVFIQAISNLRWLPAFFTITYTAGVCRKEGHLPKVLNQLVGITAAMDILSNKAAQNKFNSTSVSQDGISQAASGPGPQLYVQRMNDLKEKRDILLKKVRSKFNQKYYITNI